MPRLQSTPIAGDPRVDIEAQQRAQRIAMLGSLARGVGHDMRNIVMPALLRLDVLAVSTELNERTRLDLTSIRNSLMHLQHLAEGLSLLSAESVDHPDDSRFTRLDEWWASLRTILAEAIPPGTELTASIASDLPAAAISPAALAQVVASILLMTAEAMADVPVPRVSISANTDDADCLHLEIRHNGIASMPLRAPEDEVSRFGMETCRTLMRHFGGDLRVESASTSAAVFHLQLRPAGRDRRHTPRVRVLVNDPRTLAVVRMVLTQRRVTLVSADAAVDAIICDAASLPLALRTRDDVRDIDRPVARIIALGPSEHAPDEVEWIDAYDSDALTRALTLS